MPFMERLYSAMILKTPMYDPSAGEIIEHRSDAFYNAIRADDSRTVIRMIEEGFDVDHHAFGHQPPLVFAVIRQRYDIVRTLLIYGADPNLADRSGNTALHYAVQLGEPESVLQLVRYGADRSVANESGLDALSLAARSRNRSVHRILKEARPTVEVPRKTDLFALAREGNLHAVVQCSPTAVQLHERDGSQRTLLHHAVFGNNPKLLTWLLNKRLDIDAADVHGITPLIIAASHPKFLRSLEKLLARDPTLEHRTRNQATALTLALRNGNAEGARLLLEHGANILAVEGVHTPLTLVHRAIGEYPETAEDFRHLLTLLLDRGAHTDIPTNSSGWTPLFHTVARSEERSMRQHLELLLQLGSDVNCADVNGRTPLMVAASMGRQYAAEKLLENYAEIDHVDRHGWTALMLAAYYNRIAIARLLLQNGCDANLTTPQGLSAMHIARKHGRNRIIEMLLDYGAREVNDIEEE